MFIPDDYREIFAAAPDATLVVAGDGTILAVNPRGIELFGYSEEDLVGQGVEMLVPDALRKGHARHRGEYESAPRTRPMGIGLELHARRADGTLVPVEISLSPWRQGGETRVICSIRDISDRLRLKHFGTSTLRATEKERERISRELHDDTAQQLAALLVWLHLAEAAKSGTERRRQLAEVRRGLQEAAESVHRIARGLRPPELQDAGVGPAIQAHVRQVARVTTAHIDTDLESVDSRLDPDAQLVLYRVVQEALSNAIRHAEAERVAVTVKAQNGVVVAEITDDGCGFEPERVGDELGGLGLLGMEERAAMVGGTLTVDSRAGEGATIRLEIPTAKGHGHG
jgi:PAS domain S-box-containing protein